MSRFTPAAGLEPVQSYPSFWDAVPVEAPNPAPAARATPADAYALFADAADVTPGSLSVEQTDVG
jgi:hypothetical protein